jgi:hypothetical protein
MEPHQKLSPEDLFERHFRHLYPEDALSDLARARATDVNPARNPHILASLDEIAETFVRLAPATFGGSGLVLDGTDASVHRLSLELSRERRDRWAEERGPGGASILSQVVIHGAIYVAGCAVRNHQGTWLVRRPLWESQVRVVSPAGEADLAVFHWWLKALSDTEIDRPSLSDRYRAHVEQPRLKTETLLPILPEPRPIPRLAKVRYDTLYKHFRAHLPELRDLGEHFPSAERLAELGFRHLDFMWLGGARMLLLHGPTSRGVHLFWLDRHGFVSAAFYPADAMTPYTIALEGTSLRVSLVCSGARGEHIVLWWGP